MDIVFDLGGVVVTWDPDAVVERLIDDPRGRRLVRRRVMDHPDWIELDRGALPLHDAVARAARRTGLEEPFLAEFFRRVPEELVAIPQTVDLLYRLRQRGHRLYCLSNMHLASIEYLEKRYDFWHVFSGRVISCRLKHCKPEAAIYRHLLECYQLSGDRLLFVDDIEANLAAAAAFGMRGIKFSGAAECERELRKLGA